MQAKNGHETPSSASSSSENSEPTVKLGVASPELQKLNASPVREEETFASAMKSIPVTKASDKAAEYIEKRIN